ncbi:MULTISPECIES: anti-sigma factor family protein [Marinobacter]|uniref:Anti-sigma factor n=1 Tax=Marinobacter profundi TaxID=2666256 RepID=A0A2G1UJV6_9GAMM|nr:MULTISPECIES: zf-HC2 domain-containing protein [Marinobacter]MBD3656046.1 zf-HC2 domain-containing protein [Marinobacter sp.]PHQ14700.1 anti-sigma factor [Marinobacter profundi]
MTCRDCQRDLVSYILNELPAAQAKGVAAHLAGCERCLSRLASERAILDALAQHGIPDPSPDFEQRVLGAATTRHGGGGAGQGWSTPILGGAIAAALALGIALGVGLKSGSGEGEPSAMADATATSVAPVAEGSSDSVPVVVDSVRTVRLAFNSGEALTGVTLTLELPPHVELATYPGHHQLSWKVDLAAGENVLALPLRVLFPGAGELVAHLDDGRRQKTFRASIPGATAAATTEPAS